MRQIGALFILCLLLAPSVMVLGDERSLDKKPQRITIRLLEYRFEPVQITLKIGEEIELTLDNEGTVLHEFITEALKNLNVEVRVNGAVAETLGITELEIPAKGKVTLRFTPDKPGEFQMSCRATEPKDHFREGMTGKLLIR